MPETATWGDFRQIDQRQLQGGAFGERNLSDDAIGFMSNSEFQGWASEVSKYGSETRKAFYNTNNPESPVARRRKWVADCQAHYQKNKKSIDEFLSREAGVSETRNASAQSNPLAGFGNNETAQAMRGQYGIADNPSPAAKANATSASEKAYNYLFDMSEGRRNLSTYKNVVRYCVGMAGKIAANSANLIVSDSRTGDIIPNDNVAGGPTFQFARAIVAWHYGGDPTMKDGTSMKSAERIASNADKKLFAQNYGDLFTRDYGEGGITASSTNPVQAGDAMNYYNRIITERFTLMANMFDIAGIDLENEYGGAFGRELTVEGLQQLIGALASRNTSTSAGASGLAPNQIQALEQHFRVWAEAKKAAYNLAPYINSLSDKDYADYMVCYLRVRESDQGKGEFPWWEDKDECLKHKEAAEQILYNYQHYEEAREAARKAGMPSTSGGAVTSGGGMERYPEQEDSGNGNNLISSLFGGIPFNS